MNLIWVMPAKGCALRELELLDRIDAAVTARPGVSLGIGDDAAVLTGDPAIVAGHDLLVEGVHFRRSTTGLGDLGHKSLAANLSDIAAMGAEPVAALVGLGLPDDGLSDSLDELYAGMEALAARVGASIAGGDISASPAFFIAITAIGRLPSGRAAVRRDGARPGDALCLTGSVGGSGAGLALLEEPAIADRIVGGGVEDAVRRHRRPEPRLAEGRLLAGAGATAMMDVSDGLATDALRLARASGVGLTIDLDRLPLHPSTAVVAKALDRDARRVAWVGGEDYELLVALPAAALKTIAPRLPAGLTAIGQVTAGPPVLDLRLEGARLDIDEPGYLHHV